MGRAGRSCGQIAENRSASLVPFQDSGGTVAYSNNPHTSGTYPMVNDIILLESDNFVRISTTKTVYETIKVFIKNSPLFS